MIKATDCIAIMARRGHGKSHLAKGIQKIWPKRVIIDSLSEYQEEKKKKNGDFENSIIVNNFDLFCQKMDELKNNKSEKFVLIFNFDPESDLNLEIFENILRICFYFQNIQIVIEEVQLYSSPHFLPHWLKQCLLVGRHKGLSLLFTTQRPGELNKTILSQCSHIFCGKITEGNDLKYISNFLNQDAEKLINIQHRKFLYFSDDGIKEISNDF